MPEKWFRKGCFGCTEYRNDLKRCRNVKSNPGNFKRTREVMNLMGYDYICNRNQFKRSVLSELRSNRRDPSLEVKGALAW